MKYLRRHVGKRVVVALDALTWSGTLDVADRDHIELVSAKAGVESSTPADGRIAIPEIQIQFVQVLG